MQTVAVITLVVLIVLMLSWKGFLWWARPKMSKFIMTFYRQPNEWLTWKEIKIETGLSTGFIIWTLLSLSAPHMPMRIRPRSSKQQRRISDLTWEPVPKNNRPEEAIETIFFQFQFDFRRGIGGRQKQSFLIRSIMPKPAMVPA